MTNSITAIMLGVISLPITMLFDSKLKWVFFVDFAGPITFANNDILTL